VPILAIVLPIEVTLDAKVESSQFSIADDIAENEAKADDAPFAILARVSPKPFCNPFPNFEIFPLTSPAATASRLNCSADNPAYSAISVNFWSETPSFWAKIEKACPADAPAVLLAALIWVNADCNFVLNVSASLVFSCSSCYNLSSQDTSIPVPCKEAFNASNKISNLSNEVEILSAFKLSRTSLNPLALALKPCAAWLNALNLWISYSNDAEVFWISASFANN
jgi:hypothetical protein